MGLGVARQYAGYPVSDAIKSFVYFLRLSHLFLTTLPAAPAPAACCCKCSCTATPLMYTPHFCYTLHLFIRYETPTITCIGFAEGLSVRTAQQKPQTSIICNRKRVLKINSTPLPGADAYPFDGSSVVTLRREAWSHVTCDACGV